MLNLNNLINCCYIEVTSLNSIKTIELAKSKYNSKNILCLFFHYNKELVKEDYQLITKIENKTNMHINWIDISTLYEETKKINNSLGLYICNNKSEEYNKNIRNKIILKEIKDYFKDNLVKYKQFTEIKG